MTALSAGPAADVAPQREPLVEAARGWTSARIHGPFALALFAFMVAFGVWHVLTNIVIAEPGLWQNAIHYAGFGALAALIAPLTGRLRWWDGVYAGLVLWAALWIAHAENGIYARTLAETGLPWQFRPIDWAAGIIAIVAAIDLTRRMTGWIIPVLIIGSLA